MRPILDDRYCLLETVHDGDEVCVKRAEDLHTSTTIAIKLLRHSAQSSKRLLALKREFSLLIQLRHPHIVRVLDFGRCEAFGHYFTMEYLGPHTFSSLAGSLNQSQIKSALVQLTRAIEYLKSRGVWHRDISPSNVVLQRDADQVRAVLIDFDLAEPVGAIRTGPRGTPPHIAPETLAGREADLRSELYSLGTTILTAFSSPPSLSVENSAARVAMVASLDMPADRDPALGALLRRMTSQDPSSRPANAEEIISALSSEPEGSQPPPPGSEIHALLAHLPMYGHAQVISDIEASLSAAVSQQQDPLHDVPRVYLVGGESGIGKSRLLAESRIRSQLMGLKTLSIECNPHGEDPFDILHSLVRRLCPEEPEALPLGVSLRSQRVLAPADLSLTPTPGVSPPSSTRPFIEPLHAGNNSIQLRAIHGLGHRILEISAKTPLTLIFEDIEYADLETFKLIRYLAVQRRGPVVLASYQSETHPNAELESFLRYVGSKDISRHLVLDRLDAEETARFVDAALGGAPNAIQLGNAVHRLTGGNPLLIQETLINFAESGHLLKSPNGWEIQLRSIDLSDLPNNLRAFAQSKLSKLQDRLRRVLELLAVLDAPATAMHTAALSHRNADSLENDLEALVSLGLLTGEGSDHGRLYTFRHRSVRELLYEELDASRRRQIHHTIATAIEKSSAHRSDSAIEQIAHHYIQAMDLSKAPEFAFRAAYLALERSAIDRAIHLFDRGLDLTPREDISRRFQGLEMIGSLLVMTGDLQRATRFYQEMQILGRTAGAPEKEALAIRALGRLLIDSGEVMRGLAYANEAMRRFKNLGQDAGEVGAVLVRAYGLYVTCDWAEAVTVATEGHERALQTGDVYWQSVARNVQGLSECARGNYSRAISAFNDCLILKISIDDIVGIVMAYNNIGLTYLEQNQLDQARRYFEKALSEARSKGGSWARILPSLNLGEILYLTGDLTKADSLSREALSLADGANRKQFAAYATYSLANISALRGQFSKSIMFLGKAEASNKEIGSRLELSLVLTSKAELMHVIGDAAAANEAIREALRVATEVGNRPALAAARAVAATLLVRDQPEEARALLADAHLEEAKKSGRTHALCRFLEARGMLALTENNLPLAVENLAEMKSIARETGLRPDVARASLLEGQALLALGRRTEARLVLEQGSSLARDIGLRPLLTHLLYWLSRAQDAGEDAAAAADSVLESAGLIKEMASEITNTEMKVTYLQTETNSQILETAARLERAGVKRRPIAGGPSLDPDQAALKAFDEVSRKLGAEAPLRQVLTAVLDKAIEAIRADRGLLILLDPADAEVTIARNLEGETIQDATDYCRSILKEVSAGEPILAVDAPGDERFRARRSVAQFNIISLMCVPLKLGDRVLGALYFDSRSADRLFHQDDLALVQAFASKVAAAIAEAQETQRLRERAVVLNRELAKRYHMDSLIGRSPAMQRLFQMMAATIRADCNVLLVGESGTGKELAARAIHFGGARKLSNFVPLDCGAVPETLIESELFGYKRGAFSGADLDKKGLFEEADGGTLFLDEITNTSPAFQAKLLRVLESGEFRRLGETLTRRADVRIIAATNADIDEAMKDGRFREDLYYRLNVVTLRLPPLRERREDIPLLAEHFARQFCEERGVPFMGIGEGALARLQAHPWPGNVRELQHAIESALVVAGRDGMVRRESLPERLLGGELEVVRDLLQPESGDETDPLSAPASEQEKTLVQEALIQAGGDKSRAARILGWNRMRLYRRLKSLGISYDVGKERDEQVQVEAGPATQNAAG